MQCAVEKFHVGAASSCIVPGLKTWNYTSQVRFNQIVDESIKQLIKFDFLLSMKKNAVSEKWMYFFRVYCTPYIFHSAAV